MIKILRLDSGTPEEWVIYLIQMALVGKNITASPTLHKCIKRVLRGDVKVEFFQHTNIVNSHTVVNFTEVMATITLHVFLKCTHCDKRRYMEWNLRKASVS